MPQNRSGAAEFVSMPEFDPGLCRNESEVESKFIVGYLLPALGYDRWSWYQEVAIGGRIRLDFLAFAAKMLPRTVQDEDPLCLVIEAKSPAQNLDRHEYKMQQRYLASLRVPFGLLTNGKEVRVYERRGDRAVLVFSCGGVEVVDRLEELRALVGREAMRERLGLGPEEEKAEELEQGLGTVDFENFGKSGDQTGTVGATISSEGGNPPGEVPVKSRLRLMEVASVQKSDSIEVSSSV
ncbi:MAG: hypothetical protein ACO4CG_14870, partial [Prochlorothrix sp.]